MKVRSFTLIAALLLLWLAASAWMRPLALPDEGRYVGVAWEMMRSGEWLTPTLNGLPFFHKPPLFYWITAGSLSLFGVNEWAARVAPLLGAWLGAFSLYLFTRRWLNEGHARLTLLVLAAQPLFYIGAQFANLDMLVAGCISATILLLAHAALSLEHDMPYRRALLGAYAMAALGVLSKGLIGAVLPALVIVSWLALRGRWRVLLALLSLPGLLVFMLLASPWFAVMQSRFPDFLDYFFIVQHFKRFAGGGFNNVQPFWFYPAVLLLLGLPCAPWLYRQITLAPRGRAQGGEIRLLMWLWVALVMLFFSLPKSKLLGYILPVIPPLAFLIMDGFVSRSEPSTRRRRAWWLSLGLSAAVGLGVVTHFTIYPRTSARALASALVAQHPANEPILMLHEYYYDLPFYARLGHAVGVVNDWDDPAIRTGDDGRKELLDAGQFSPERSRAALITPDRVAPVVCASAVSWLIGSPAIRSRYPFLDHATVSFAQDNIMLWRVERAQPELASALHCAG